MFYNIERQTHIHKHEIEGGRYTDRQLNRQTDSSVSGFCRGRQITLLMDPNYPIHRTSRLRRHSASSQTHYCIENKSYHGKSLIS